MQNERLIRRLLPLSIFVGAIAVLSPACSSGPGFNDCFDYTTFDSKTPTVSFRTDVLPLFRNSCGLSDVCHGSQSPQTPAQHFYGPKLTDPAPTDADIALILSEAAKSSVDEPDMPVISPGHPEASFMMYKLDGDPQDPTSVNCAKLACVAKGTCLGAMPQAGNTLPADKRDLVRRWIAQGAPNN